MKKAGDKIADFTLKDADGRDVHLSDFSGKKKIIYFYPRDSTPGCTKEACEFRDTYENFREKNTVIIGISADSEKAHVKFRGTHNLPFILLSDPEKRIITEFGAVGEKSMYGKTFIGILRTTYLLDENDTVLKVYEKVKPAGHAEEVLGDL